MKIKSIIFIFIASAFVFSCSQPTEPITPPTNQNRTIFITSTSDNGPGSLRQALQDTQPNDTILFDPEVFPPDDPATITVTSELPHIQIDHLTLDASNAGVILDGSQLQGEWVAGLQIVSYGANNVVWGFQISNFPGPAIALSGNSKHNVIGGDRSIGTGPFGRGNMVTNNAAGIDLSMIGTTLNTVTGNLIGTDAAGSEGLGNYRSGVLFWEGTHDNTIGPDNIIAYNVECGVGVSDADSTVNTVIQNSIYNNGEIGTCLEDSRTDIAESSPGSEEETLLDGKPDMIFHNGTIITMDNSLQIAEAIAIKDGIITSVGNNQEILAFVSENCEIIDLGGKTLMPGFIDAHNHLMEAHKKNFAEEQDLILANGVTTIGILFATQEWIDELNTFNQQTGLKIRTNLYLTYSNFCGEVFGDWYTQFPPTQDKSEMLRIAGVKVYADGGGCNAPAVSYEYPEGGYGDLYFTQDEMNQIVRDINNNGYQAAIHAAGDRAAEQVLNAIETANAENAIEMRNRIEHNSLIRDEMLGRHDESGAVAIIFGSYPTCYFNGENEKANSRTPEEFKHTEWRWKDLIDANPNTVFAWHSDVSTVEGPKALGIFVLNPLKNIYGFVTRREIKGDGSICEPQEWMKENTITVEQALPIMTINSAYALNMDDVIGSLEPGKYADMIILSENPLTVDPERLDDIEVLMTMVNGKTEFCATGYSEYCP